MTLKFRQDDPVEVHSLGPKYINKTFRGIIRGLAINQGDDPATIWIVEMLDLLEPDQKFSHVTMPQACLRSR